MHGAGGSCGGGCGDRWCGHSVVRDGGGIGCPRNGQRRRAALGGAAGAADRWFNRFHRLMKNYGSRCLTPSRSSVSSFSVRLMRSCENASISRPWTILYSPFSVVTGKPNMVPSGMPYEPSDGMPMVVHLPPVPTCQSCMWSMAALAADAADDRPRASMMAAPRLPTVGRKVLAFHSWSLIRSLTDLPLTLAKR